MLIHEFQEASLYLAEHPNEVNSKEKQTSKRFPYFGRGQMFCVLLFLTIKLH